MKGPDKKQEKYHNIKLKKELLDKLCKISNGVKKYKIGNYVVEAKALNNEGFVVKIGMKGDFSTTTDDIFSLSEYHISQNGRVNKVVNKQNMQVVKGRKVQAFSDVLQYIVNEIKVN